MNIGIQQIQAVSEDGDRDYPNELIIEMDGSKPDCPITFYSAGFPIFSLGSYEVADFCKAIQNLVP